MRFRGKIKNLNHIIISDPSYDEKVTCRYERNNLNKKNWCVNIDISHIEDKIEGFTIKGVEFFLLLSKNEKISESKENGTISYLKGIEIKETEIGMDTASVALGVNENAEEIIKYRDEWQPEFSLNTLTDGIFGSVKEGKLQDEVVFIWLSGYLDEDTEYTMDEIIDYLQNQLNITELEKTIDRPQIIKQENILEKMSDIALKFKEITKEDSKLINFFGEDKRFTSIMYAGAYLGGIAIRNEQRKAGNLDGEIEQSPFSNEQEKLIDEYTDLSFLVLRLI